MNLQTIDEVYQANAEIRQKFVDTVGGLTQDQIDRRPASGWTVHQIVEHVSLVDEGMVKICSKLLRKAQADGRAADGKIVLSDAFLRKAAEIDGVKLEAPEIVQPTAGRSVSESLMKMDESQNLADAIKELFLTCDGTEHKFPHPFLGPMSAHEWLVLRGWHEMRHLRQIEKIISE